MPEYDIKFVIASHIRYYEKTLPRLIQSLVSLNAVPPQQVIAVVGGFDAPRIETAGGVQYRYVTHNSFDHTGLVEVVEAGLDADWWCYLHDTCEAGAQFYRRLKERIDPAFQHMPFDADGWMNIGVMSREGVRELENYIRSLRDCDKMRAVKSERLYNRMLHSKPLNAPEERVQNKDRKFVYGDSVSRLVIHFTGVDLKKYQANSDRNHFGYFEA